MHRSLSGPNVELKGTHTSLCLTKEAISKCSEAQVLLGKTIKISERIHQLKLQQTELALFASVILLSDSPLLEERERIRSIAGDVTQALQMELGHIRSEDNDIFLSFLALKEDLKQASEEFISNLKAGSYSLPEDVCDGLLLLKDIFDI
ncbi:hypothetical protein KP79_PYT17693 [Mizuhopecten yessoensis]|uniref:Uncharacterized protein n=2 Tax=Mizuhopecten yessoensis TaxID=6573 RepID=A0A210QD95_MIZYE|nr:hypothetical protein KP79_PYT17693 [Mizuhopecten yessoensis]